LGDGPETLKRLQHPLFGRELRPLINSANVQDRELAGIIVDELNALEEARREGKKHKDEDRLRGPNLDEIGYLQLYTKGHSLRVYFSLIDGNLWMLALDEGKRRKHLTDGTKIMLRTRLIEAHQYAQECRAERPQATPKTQRKAVHHG
jgi:hypothetical protein